MHPMSLSGKQVCFIILVRTIPDLWSGSSVLVWGIKVFTEYMKNVWDWKLIFKICALISELAN